MITYHIVNEKYPNHKVLGIESVWYPGRGWVPWTEIYVLGTKGLSRDFILEKAFAEGAEKASLVLSAFNKTKLIWADFSKEELTTLPNQSGEKEGVV